MKHRFDYTHEELEWNKYLQTVSQKTKTPSCDIAVSYLSTGFAWTTCGKKKLPPKQSVNYIASAPPPAPPPVSVYEILSYLYKGKRFTRRFIK
jgi:hypothetical protein